MQKVLQDLRKGHQAQLGEEAHPLLAASAGWGACGVRTASHWGQVRWVRVGGSSAGQEHVKQQQFEEQ
jgi:hypothetical protein